MRKRRRSFGPQEEEFGREVSHPTGREVRKEKIIHNNQKIATRKVHTNEIHAKLGHPVEYKMHVTMKNLHYNIKGNLEVCEDCVT